MRRESIWTNSWKNFKRKPSHLLKIIKRGYLKIKRLSLTVKMKFMPSRKSFPCRKLEIKELAKLKEEAETSRHQILSHELFP
ncbi:hypothetical protein H5410_003844 [Solanum commersonii]|uniref:Uncharacterized protein n=1 Tax=Solanum commersonii TaxID=4109 RepID=A0A9J6B6T3_SOLCO|nr:hypothetical protein H5410_003844 [Solanum commersonii]